MTDSNDSQLIGISNNRLLHMRQVAARAQEISIEIFGWPEHKARSMFILGFLHDIGYAFSSDQRQHEELGGECLHEIGYKHWREVYYHGNPDSPYDSDELFVLNLADMQTSSGGQRVTMEERLDDIASRYGNDSLQFILAQRLAQSIEKKLQVINQCDD